MIEGWLVIQMMINWFFNLIKKTLHSELSKQATGPYYYDYLSLFSATYFIGYNFEWQWMMITKKNLFYNVDNAGQDALSQIDQIIRTLNRNDDWCWQW